MFYGDDGQYNLEKIIQLVRELEPDIVCLQEATAHGLGVFKEKTGLKYHIKQGGVSILSNREMVEYPVARTAKNMMLRIVTAQFKVPRTVTAQFQTENDTPFYVTALHLDHRVEPNRMRELAAIRKTLDPIFEQKSAQFWVGDFNSLAREDYDEEYWSEIVRIRKQNSWEPPKTQVTSKMIEMGFEDSWKLADQPPPVSTCRFNTHIDYVFINKEAEKIFSLKSVLHHPSQASDHAPVLVTLEEKPSS